MTGSKFSRLVEGLQQGDPLTLSIVIGAVVGTIVIYVACEIVQKRRKP